jgi:hypothetical protein
LYSKLTPHLSTSCQTQSSKEFLQEEVLPQAALRHTRTCHTATFELPASTSFDRKSEAGGQDIVRRDRLVEREGLLVMMWSAIFANNLR